MTLRSIRWISDSGLLVGLTTIGEFAGPPVLAPLSFSATRFSLTVPADGSISGTTAGSAITAVGLPVGLTIGVARNWAYDGGGTAGAYVVLLTETLSGCVNSPLTTSITVAIAPLNAALDFSQSANSGLIAAMRSF